jgi:hypothetical protein
MRFAPLLPAGRERAEDKGVTELTYTVLWSVANAVCSFLQPNSNGSDEEKPAVLRPIILNEYIFYSTGVMGLDRWHAYAHWSSSPSTLPTISCSITQEQHSVSN